MEDRERVRTALKKFHDGSLVYRRTITKALIAAYEQQVQQTFNVEFPTPAPPPPPDANGPVVEVEPGQNLQLAIDGLATSGTVLLWPDTDYPAFTIPARSSGRLVVRPKLDLPPGRLTPASLPFKLPRIVGGGGDRITFRPGARDATIMGVEIAAVPATTVISVGTSYETSLDQLPAGTTFDRIWIHCDPRLGGHRGIACNGKWFGLYRSRIEGFWQIGRDSQAVCGWSGPGPFEIIDNYLEASGENVLFGGADSFIPVNRQPANLKFLGNYCAKPLPWKYLAGSCKNLFELKNLRGTNLVEGNRFENSWVDAQSGHGILMTVRGVNPDSIIENVTFRRNVISNTEGFAFDLLGWDSDPNYPKNAQCRNLVIDNNLMVQCADGILVVLGWDGLQISHNTMPHIRGRFLSLDAPLQYTDPALNALQAAIDKGYEPTDDERAALSAGVLVLQNPAHTVKQLVVRDNVLRSGEYAIVGNNTGTGVASLERFAPGYSLRRNVLEQVNWEPGCPFPADNVELPYDALAALLETDYIVKAGGAADIATTDGLKVGFQG